MQCENLLLLRFGGGGQVPGNPCPRFSTVFCKILLNFGSLNFASASVSRSRDGMSFRLEVDFEGRGKGERGGEGGSRA
jgi:hypothetical protein